MWAAFQTEKFSGVAAASPSVWFPDFVGYMKENKIKCDAVYLSLGDKEERTKNAVMSKVGNCIRESYDLLTGQGIECALEWNKGGHFKDWVDLREGDSFGNTYQTVIDASKGIFVPRGVANGFQVLTDKVAYTYLVNDYWALELKPKYAFVNYADPSLDIQWENLEEAEVSEADKNHPLLKDVKPLRAEDL